MSVKVVVVGGGAAGLIAAGFAAKQGADVTVVEKMNILGKKIRISGKGRCNITNAADQTTFIQNYPGNGRFLYSALHRFSNWELLHFLRTLGVETKIERGDRVFPVSDDANQIAEALSNFARSQGVDILLNSTVTKILTEDNSVVGIELSTKIRIRADRVIVTTGGASYPGTGSTGDGYRLAKSVGHAVTPAIPALVPLRIKEDWVKKLTGLSLRNVTLTVSNGRVEHQLFGEMQFTHFGITGPIVLTLSRQVATWIQQGCAKIEAFIDLKPALNHEALDQRIVRDFEQYARKQFRNGLGDLLPKSLIPFVISLSGINPEKQISQITKVQRQALINLFKKLPLTIAGTLPLSAAIVTAGGVEVKAIDPRTMESKQIKGLFFAGEVLDIDGVTGGFNLQAAFSTGYLAGISGAQV